MIEITAKPIDAAALTERVRSPRAGAVCTFLGTVRELTGTRRTAALQYEAYTEMALAKMAELEEEARRRWPIIEAVLVHRVGHLDLGEISVVVAVSCPHRHQAFDACRWLIDTFKESVPVWKRELWADGTEEWVHPGLEAPPTLSEEPSFTGIEAVNHVAPVASSGHAAGGNTLVQAYGEAEMPQKTPPAV